MGYLVSFARYSNLLVENREIFIPHLYLALLQGGWPRRNFVKMFDAGKTRMIGLPYGVKNCDDMLNRFHLIPERNGQTDGRTDRQTDWFAIWISRVSMLTRDKNLTVSDYWLDLTSLYCHYCHYCHEASADSPIIGLFVIVLHPTRSLSSVCDHVIEQRPAGNGCKYFHDVSFTTEPDPWPTSFIHQRYTETHRRTDGKVISINTT